MATTSETSQTIHACYGSDGSNITRSHLVDKQTVTPHWDGHKKIVPKIICLSQHCRSCLTSKARSQPIIIAIKKSVQDPCEDCDVVLEGICIRVTRNWPKKNFNMCWTLCCIHKSEKLCGGVITILWWHDNTITVQFKGACLYWFIELADHQGQTEIPSYTMLKCVTVSPVQQIFLLLWITDVSVTSA